MRQILTADRWWPRCSRAACGKSEAQKQAEQAAEDLKKAAEDDGRRRRRSRAPRRGARRQRHGEGHAGHGGGDRADRRRRQAVEPVAFQTLQSHSAESLRLGDGRARGRAHDDARAVLAGRDARTRRARRASTSKIVDTGFAQMLMAPWSMMLASGYSRESSRRLREVDHARRATRRSRSGTRATKNGELDVLVGKRFMLSHRRATTSPTSSSSRTSRRTWIFGKIAALK